MRVKTNFSGLRFFVSEKQKNFVEWVNQFIVFLLSLVIIGWPGVLLAGSEMKLIHFIFLKSLRCGLHPLGKAEK